MADDLWWVLDDLTMYHYSRSAAAAAVEAGVLALDFASANFGADAINTLSSRSNLANAYELAGDLARAVPLLKSTLADRERVLGPDHPHTLVGRNSLAYAYRSAGDLGRAIPLFEATLADCERVLGPDHAQTLTSRSNLANAYEATPLAPSPSTWPSWPTASECSAPTTLIPS